MAGIYFHIPFCKQACHYCDFHFSTSLQYKDAMLRAMQDELVLQQDYLSNEPIETIYFGGGTPSLLPGDEIHALTDSVAQHYELSERAEITLEANPDDLDQKKVREFRSTPVNRFSIGIQSFFDEDLRWMNRAHSSAEAENSVKRVQDAGFENITADLIYGYPLLSDDKFRQNINRLLALSVPHISAYSMTVEPQTALAAFIRKGTQRPMNESQSAEQFQLLSGVLQDAGFEHYEISNFAAGQRYSRHNTNYWKGVSYLGIGPSAHSFNGLERQWNIANNAAYIEKLLQKSIPAEKEILSPANRLNEYLMTSLRTMWGTDLDLIEKNFGQSYRDEISASVSKLIEKQMLIRNDNIITLSLEGKLLADQIASDLFVEDH